MNSKKGFTLVELLGVLVVLGLISVIIVPKVIDSITTSKEAAYQTQVETIENAAKNLVLEIKFTLSKRRGKEIYCSKGFDCCW